MTLVERLTGCIVGWCVVWERTEAMAQAMVDNAPQAVLYFSDDFPTYLAVIYKPGIHIAMTNKSQTYRVEGELGKT
jgi:hypothetical protein